MNDSPQKIRWILLPLLVIAVGIAVFVALVRTRPQPQKEARVERGELVQVGSVSRITVNPSVEAQGSVVPSRQVVLAPQVTGRVIWQSDDLVPGGRFKKGQLLLRIDPSDYVLQAKQQGAAVERAEVDLQLEQSRREIAKREWEIIGEEPNATKEGKAVALREPQLKGAQMALESARSARQQAELAVSRTTIVAPFNGFVKEESVDLGQLVSPATPLATIIGTDSFWIQVSVPPEALPNMSVPGLNAREGEGSAATVWQDVGAVRVEKPGRVVRLLGDLDPVGRMARLLVEIADPMDLATPDDARGRRKPKAPGSTAPPDSAANGDAGKRKNLPILVGAYVHVRIDAHPIADVIEVPRIALRDGDRVYVFGKDGRLEVRDVSIVWRGADSVLVKTGLEAGDEIITSRLPGAVPGMRLRKAQASPGKPVLGKR